MADGNGGQGGGQGAGAAGAGGQGAGAAGAGAAGAGAGAAGAGAAGAGQQQQGGFKLALDTPIDHALFSPEIQTQLKASKIDTVQGLVDWGSNLEKLIGQQRLLAPKPGEMVKYFGDNKQAFGVPDTPEEYQFDKPQMPKGMEWDGELEAKARKFAHERNVPQEFFKDFADFIAQDRIGSFDRMQKHGEKETADLKETISKEWGPDLDKNVEIAQFAMREIGAPAELLNQVSKEIGSPGLVKLAHLFGAKMAGATLITGDGASADAGKAAARAELDKLDRDPEHSKAMGNRSHPGHKAAVARQEELMKKIHS